MGQKTHPYGFRLGVTKTWRSRWFAKQDYAKLLHEDLQLKASLRDRLKAAGVSSIEVDRPGNKLRITISTSRPGIIIGRKGAEIEKLKSDLAKKTNREIFIDILEVHKDAIGKGSRVLIVDDLLATGGTARAVTQLVEGLGGTVAGLGFVVELTFLHGRGKLGGYDVFSLLQYDK